MHLPKPNSYDEEGLVKFLGQLGADASNGSGRLQLRSFALFDPGTGKYSEPQHHATFGGYIMAALSDSQLKKLIETVPVMKGQLEAQIAAGEDPFVEFESNEWLGFKVQLIQMPGRDKPNTPTIIAMSNGHVLCKMGLASLELMFNMTGERRAKLEALTAEPEKKSRQEGQVENYAKIYGAGGVAAGNTQQA